LSADSDDSNNAGYSNNDTGHGGKAAHDNNKHNDAATFDDVS
jgi:hypothetical protein